MKVHVSRVLMAVAGAAVAVPLVVASVFAASPVVDFTTAIGTATTSTVSDFTAALMVVAAITIALAAVRMLYRRVLGLFR
jgi:hypothetical protein